MTAGVLTAAAILLVADAVAPLSAGGRREGQPNAPTRHERPQISIEPYIDLSRRPRTDVDAPDFIMGELDRCRQAGMHRIVDCLRPNHRPVMIRRLEACVASETIPDDPRRVEACLPPQRVR
ncbi:hypothetical protein [Hyphomicrobium sp.]|uniref:hypothetical protein n=1 Tax=Hyphomicrobium sp. TaxID=82 RepID=UPI002FDDA591